jgi:hypothetical protein
MLINAIALIIVIWIAFVITFDTHESRLLYAGVLRKKLSSPFSSPAHCTRDSAFGMSGERPEGFRVAPTTRAALEPPGFSPCVSQRELRELEGRYDIGMTSFP